jgi:capsular polysaccharide biosynthesis protein
MTQAEVPLLLQQARALLAGLEARRHDPGLSADLLNLAAACHTSMLAISANDRPAAVQLALAGADLLLALPGDRPDWVPVHEEQCCRYGAIWIHELLQQGNRHSPQQLRRGIRLLERLQELHTEPLTWIATLRRDLEQAATAPLAPAEPTPALQMTSGARRSPIPYVFLDPNADFPGESSSCRSQTAPAWTPTLRTHSLRWRLETDAIVLPVGVITAQGWLSDCLQYLPQQWTHAPWVRTQAGYRLEPTADGCVQLIDEHPLPLQRLEGRWCVLNDIVAHRNLAHFFADLLPQLVAIRRLRQRWPDLQVLGQTPIYPNIKLLRDLVLPGGWHPRPAAGRLQMQELLLQPLAFNGGVGFLSRPGEEWWLAVDELREGLQLLRQALAPDPAAVWRGHWLCFSRDLTAPTDAPQGRTFSNYPELLEQLSNAGVLVIDPGLFTSRQLQLLVAEARGFVGIHGAGLMNALLGTPGARLVEIQPACGCWRMLELLGRTAGLDCRVVRCTSDRSRPELSVIPIEAVLEQLT